MVGAVKGRSFEKDQHRSTEESRQRKYKRGQTRRKGKLFFIYGGYRSSPKRVWNDLGDF